jgi:hypothetical protein
LYDVWTSVEENIPLVERCGTNKNTYLKIDNRMGISQFIKNSQISMNREKDMFVDPR